jgi:hypothetical protein
MGMDGGHEGGFNGVRSVSHRGVGMIVTTSIIVTVRRHFPDGERIIAHDELVNELRNPFRDFARDLIDHGYEAVVRLGDGLKL